MPYTYIVQCADGSFYTGWTVDLDVRLAAHNAGTGARYTRGRLPVRLVYHEEWEDASTARRRECQIKKMDRKHKEDLVGAK